MWFVLHLVFQFVGFVLFCCGFAVAVIKFDVNSMPGGNAGKAHAYMGYALMGMASLQVILEQG